MLLAGRFVPRSSFLDIVLVACWAFCSWILVPGYCACYLLGVLLLVLGVLSLGPRSWVLCLLLAGRFVLGSSFSDIVLVTCWAFYSSFLGFCSWILVPFLTLGLLALLAPRHCGFVGVVGSWRYWLLGIAGSWALLAPGIAGSWELWELWEP